MLTNDNTSVNISSSLEQKYLKITEGITWRTTKNQTLKIFCRFVIFINPLVTMQS